MDLLGNDILIDEILNATDTGSYSVDDILAEYSDFGLTPKPEDDIGRNSHRIVMEALDETFSSSQLGSREADGTEYSPPPKSYAPEPPAPVFDEDEDVKIYGAVAVDRFADDDVKVYKLDDILAEAERLSANWNTPRGASATVTKPEPETLSDADEEEYYLPEDWDTYEQELPGPDDTQYAAPAEEWQESRPRHEKKDESEKSIGQMISVPFLSLMAFISMKKHSRKGGSAMAEEDEEDLGPEMSAEDASKYYAGHLRSLSIRSKIALVVSIILIWLSIGLPAFGALGSDLRIRSLVCLILELTIMMLGLDVFTSGMMSLYRGKPGMWSLVAFSCIVSALDAAVTYAIGDSGWGLPFCAAAGLSMTFALFGAELTCRGLRQSLKALELSKTPYSVTCEPDVSEEGTTILKSSRETAGYLRRCEEPDAAENAYSTLAPILIVAALLLSAFATVISKNWTGFFRILAAITAPAAPFAAFLACPLPFSILSHQVFKSGAAVAGWGGLSDIGQAKHLIVTDSDIFPASTVSIESIRVLAGILPERAIAAAGSIICASGSGLAPVFLELMRRNNCTMQRIEDFGCHEGGGLKALINGENVLCGSAGFMHLMSVRLPQKLSSKSAVFLAINGELTAIFTIKYVPMTSVQSALAQLLHGRRNPIFAIRDFLVTPLMIRQKFRLPTDGFDFPSFSRRYEISAAQPDISSPISAILSREGLGTLVEVYGRGRNSYICASLSTVLSLVCTVVGMALMFILSITGAMDSVSISNMLTYLSLWLVPTILMGIGLSR